MVQILRIAYFKLLTFRFTPTPRSSKFRIRPIGYRLDKRIRLFFL
jgi:hypothetical protein